MDIIHQYTAFFSGCFTVNKSLDGKVAAALQKGGWEREDSTFINTGRSKHIYYDEFIEFCAGKTPEVGCVAYQYKIDADASCMNLQEKICNYHIPTLYCFLLPFNIVIFSFEVTMETNSLDDIKYVASHLRLLQRVPEVSDVLLELYKVLTGKKIEDVTEISELGYKLKYFQIINSDAEPNSMVPDERMRTLYQLATHESSTLEKKVCFCEEYVTNVIKEHVLSVFNNWDAMSLLDSFTIHAFQAEEFQLLLWRREFFRMIYIQSLFQKFYLQSLNLRFRKIMGCRNEKELEVLLHEFEHYERICHFNKISYAFLPLLIDESIDTALEIKEERAMLTEHIKREQTLHKSVNDKRGNRLLAVISALAAFSAIWDLSCLINEVFPYEQVFCCSRVGYAVMSGLFLLILVIILFVVSIMKKRNEV